MEKERILYPDADSNPYATSNPYESQDHEDSPNNSHQEDKIELEGHPRAKFFLRDLEFNRKMDDFMNLAKPQKDEIFRKWLDDRKNKTA